MALSAASMKKDIIDALKSGADNAADANKKFGNAILKNICDNILIVYGWSAALTSTPFTSDSAVEFTATVSGGGTLTPSATFADMLLKLAVLIKGLVISAPAGYAVAPLAFNPAGTLNVIMEKETTQDLAMTNFCTQIIASIIFSFPNPTPGAGTHAAYTGATTSMVIK